ncbi:MAG TPA: hypothetical protein VIF10_13055 [Methylobacter sp.]|jgi:hypothetical protein
MNKMHERTYQSMKVQPDNIFLKKIIIKQHQKIAINSQGTLSEDKRFVTNRPVLK